MSSPEDYPQVSIHFQKQSAHSLEFLIYLARPQVTVLPKTAIVDDHFLLSTQLVVHLRKEIPSNVPTLIEAFSLFIPIEKCKRGAAINLLYAREFVAKLLEDAIGTFRDYNGGLFETQKKRFSELTKLFSDKIAHFSLFAKDLFYALTPVETRVCLDDALFEKLFEGFSQMLSQGVSVFNRPSPHTRSVFCRNSC